MNRKGGMTGIEVIAALALLGVVTWLVKPSLFPGRSKRAADSTQATAAVEAATNAQGASAAASVVKIGEANAVAPASPSKDFIGREIPMALSRLPAPDPQALLEAERRRVAVMEGRLDEARRLYESAAKQSEKLQRERDEAIAARRAVDLQLEQAAASEHARTTQALGATLVALLLGAGWVYTKVYSVGPDTLGKIAADVRAGVKPIQALNTHLAPRLHARVRTAAKLATEPKDEPDDER
jgi:type II secretory pathway pseudopilin PulG